LKQVASETP